MTSITDLVLFPLLVVQAQDKSLDQYGVWVNIQAILVTLLLAIASVSILAQYLRAEKLARELKDQLLKQVADDMRDLKEKYKLADLKTPEQIKTEMRADFDPRIDQLRRDIDGSIRAARGELTQLQAAVATRPAMAEVMKAMEDRYKRPEELTQAHLARVMNAFLQLRDLTDSERTAIGELLLGTQAAARAGVDSDARG